MRAKNLLRSRWESAACWTSLARTTLLSQTTAPVTPGVAMEEVTSAGRGCGEPWAGPGRPQNIEWGLVWEGGGVGPGREWEQGPPSSIRHLNRAHTTAPWCAAVAMRSRFN
uniref:Uncharacterized protein n=1 Tax=Arundo donax TaxID=35708 RepID=A0A0A9H0U4_ARUDO